MAKTIANAGDSANTSKLSEDCHLPSQRDAATLLLQPSNNITFLIGRTEDWQEAGCVPVKEIFDESVLAFFDDLSKLLLADPAAHDYPDVMAFALWCRRSALATEKLRYSDRSLYLGRGLVFHVSPSNIPIMFAYTLALGLLAGNTNIVRLPSRAFPQLEYLCSKIDDLTRVEDHRGLSRYIAAVRYRREETGINTLLSHICDVRVIWGGDTTVREIRKFPLLPGAFDVVFPDRYSIAVIDSDAWVRCKNKKARIRGFYNDTYLSNQSSCSSPKAVVWLGHQVEAARSSFWALLEEHVKDQYQLAPLDALSNLEYSYCILARQANSKLCSTSVDVTRVWCEKLRAETLEEHPGGGVFVECGADSLESLKPVLQRRCQTISYYGVPANDLISLLRKLGPRGADRVVPMGSTLKFSLTWDGYDIIRTLSRRIDLVTDVVEDDP